MYSIGSDGALRRFVAMGVLAFGAAVAQAEPAKPERLARLEQRQLALACVAAMNARGDQAMRNQDSTMAGREAGLQQYMFARRVWMRDVNVDDALMNHWTRSFESQSAAERSAQSSYCFAVAADRVDAMQEHDALRLRVEAHDAAQMIWTRHRAAARTEGGKVVARTL